jgi:hypothetical protein
VAVSRVGVELVGILCVGCVGWMLARLEWNWLVYCVCVVLGGCWQGWSGTGCYIVCCVGWLLAAARNSHQKLLV